MNVIAKGRNSQANRFIERTIRSKSACGLQYPGKPCQSRIGPGTRQLEDGEHSQNQGEVSDHMSPLLFRKLKAPAGDHGQPFSISMLLKRKNNLDNMVLPKLLGR